MYQFDKIKLVIWDLDETFWNGTISEGDILIPTKNIDLLTGLIDMGVMNSICSKNDWNRVRDELKTWSILDCFVFPSVDWQPKGQRIKQIVKDMNLREENVLFLDDNHSNREEVRYLCPAMMVEGPEVIPELYVWTAKSEKKDRAHKRLIQYRILEKKREKRSEFGSNEDFLLASNIQVRIEHDCIEQIDRIHDLLLRSNQLNFTKVRSTREELLSLFYNREVECGYVSVSDKFGDYGIVGFYALQDRRLLHFTFSCRTLGMGIEQYTYNYLKRPVLSIVGEVISDLSTEEYPNWINQNSESGKAEKIQLSGIKKHQVLVKGPCDLFQIYPYISNTEIFDTDFTHTTDKGIHVESTSHTTHIVEAARLSQKEKTRVIEEVPFVDFDIYNDNIFKIPYKVVFISILSDPNLGVYRRKDTGERFAFVEYTQPITDPENWEGLISGTLRNENFPFTREVLERFSEKYEFIGRNSPTQILENIQFIRSKLNPDCMLVIMLGGELYYEKNSLDAYRDRHIVHKQVNDLLREYAKDKRNVRLMDVNKYLIDQSSFYDHFNHYTKPVYYKLAQEMVGIVNECADERVEQTGKIKMLQIRMKEELAPFYYRIRSFIRRKK